MDLALFKQRYAKFTDDTAIQLALNDASLLIGSFNIDEGKRDLALAYLTAHLLSVPQGASEPHVTKVKADSVEVQFSDNKNSDNLGWLNLSSYGKLFAMLIKPKSSGIGYFVL